MIHAAMKRRASKARIEAFTRIELIVIAFTLLMLVFVLIPSLGRAKRKAMSETCRDNLKQVGLAFRLWSGDGGVRFPHELDLKFGGTKELIDSGQVFVHFRALSNELARPKLLVCPADKEKVVATNFNSGLSDANVSYFVGLDAQDTMPYVFLSGDRNLAVGGQPLNKGLFVLTTNTPLSWTRAIHNSCGNICSADDSVRLLDSPELANAVQKQEIATNRLAIP
jgi:competence protein ComGC